MPAENASTRSGVPPDLEDGAYGVPNTLEFTNKASPVCKGTMSLALEYPEAASYRPAADLNSFMRRGAPEKNTWQKKNISQF
jgi:hypothetical protein